MAVVNINDVLDGHVALDLDCLDRIYLNAYVPNLQVGGQVVTFLTQHLGNEVPSPALFKRIGDRFRQRSRPSLRQTTFPAASQAARPYPLGRSQARSRPPAPGAGRTPGPLWGGGDRGCSGGPEGLHGLPAGKDTHGKAVNFGFDKADRAVTCYYFYVLDADFGPGFIKLCSYFPTRPRCG